MVMRMNANEFYVYDSYIFYDTNYDELSNLKIKIIKKKSCIVFNLPLPMRIYISILLIVLIFFGYSLRPCHGGAY